MTFRHLERADAAVKEESSSTMAQKCHALCRPERSALQAKQGLAHVGTAGRLC